MEAHIREACQLDHHRLGSSTGRTANRGSEAVTLYKGRTSSKKDDFLLERGGRSLASVCAVLQGMEGVIAAHYKAFL